MKIKKENIIYKIIPTVIFYAFYLFWGLFLPLEVIPGGSKKNVYSLGGENLSAQEIINRAYYRDDGKDSYFKMAMILVDKRQHKRERILELYSQDRGPLIRRYLKFLYPPRIRGTAFLSYENANMPDTQYLFLPALGRARRIVSTQRAMRFVNTDFTYEDMQRRKPDEDNHYLKGRELILGYPCYVIESLPKEAESTQYGKRRVWIGVDNYVVLKEEFYNKKGEKIKELSVEKLKKIEGIWTSMETIMMDYRNEHKTILRVLEVEYNRGVDDEIFTLSYLENN